MRTSDAEIAWRTWRQWVPARWPGLTYRRENVVQTLEWVCGRTGYAKTIRGNNGRKFISRGLDLGGYANEITLDFSGLGKPTENGLIEAFNSKLPSECMNAHWFMCRAGAKVGVDITSRTGFTALSELNSQSP